LASNGNGTINVSYAENAIFWYECCRLFTGAFIHLQKHYKGFLKAHYLVLQNIEVNNYHKNLKVHHWTLPRNI
jgi:hypothetical protein